MYNNIRKKVNKFYKGGALESRRDSGAERRIPKFLAPYQPLSYLHDRTQDGLRLIEEDDYERDIDADFVAPTVSPELQAQANAVRLQNAGIASPALQGTSGLMAISQELILEKESANIKDAKAAGILSKVGNAVSGFKEGISKEYKGQAGVGQALSDGYSDAVNAVKNGIAENWDGKLIAAAATGVALSTGAKALDAATMGDKNFGALSEAIDAGVHAVSGALMKSGNPYAMAAAGALETANFLTKAGGQTVQGFDVDINSSGYGNMGHMESSSSRDFGAMIGLGGLFTKRKMDAKLAKRNALARMALEAADIADTLRFEQEARMDSISNVIANNQAALAGGVNLGSLGA